MNRNAPGDFLLGVHPKLKNHRGKGGYSSSKGCLSTWKTSRLYCHGQCHQHHQCPEEKHQAWQREIKNQRGNFYGKDRIHTCIYISIYLYTYIYSLLAKGLSIYIYIHFYSRTSLCLKSMYPYMCILYIYMYMHMHS